MRVAAGILMIIGGFIGGTLWFTLVGEIMSDFARSVAPLSYEQATEVAVLLGFLSALIRPLPLLLAVIGGIYTLKRKRWGWALAGAICSLLFPFTGIPAIIFLIMRKGEFQG